MKNRTFSVDYIDSDGQFHVINVVVSDADYQKKKETPGWDTFFLFSINSTIRKTSKKRRNVPTCSKIRAVKEL